LAAFVVLIYLEASLNDFIIKNSKALLNAKLGLVTTQNLSTREISKSTNNQGNIK
jgi:hypothetical protein